jgi:hypothetical protein
LEKITHDLGLPAGTTLRSKLHNLLVYGPGQFFAPHQDSEKADGMIGSLVVLLPSASSGGALVIKHHDEKVSYRGSPEHIVLVAFYTDCRHEVRPITRGYRVALTFNLFMEGATGTLSSDPRAAKPVDALVELVRAHFATPRPAREPRWPSKSSPERLVFLLDHEYTQRGPSWRALKNGDAVRAGLLREVADRLDCEIVLALADVHETWSCEDDWEYEGYGYGRRRGWHPEYDDENDDAVDEGHAGEDQYTLIELCDSDIELRHWLAPSGKRVQAISNELLGDEVCFTKPSVDLEPFKSEHEGYTGNAGNTVDRWYHRAAVLLWPRARTFAIRAKAAPAWSIGEIAKALAHGHTEVAKHHVADLLPFWDEVARRDDAPDCIDQLLQVAADIDDAQLATALLDPVVVERLTPKTAGRWIALIARYGLPWCERLFELWTSRDNDHYDYARRTDWIVCLPKLCAPLCADEDGRELARGIVRAQWSWLDPLVTRLCKRLPSSDARESIEKLTRAIVSLLASAALPDDRDLQSRIMERLTAERGYPVSGAMSVLRAGEPHGRTMLGLAPLHEDCARRLTKLVATPPREPGDWSITTALRCKCDLCARLTRFCRAPNEQQHEWPLAKDRRAHVHQTITIHELPVTHVTRRVGSPYTLVLTKTKALFSRATAERAAWSRDLAWLGAVATRVAQSARGRRYRSRSTIARRPGSP